MYYVFAATWRVLPQSLSTCIGLISFTFMSLIVMAIYSAGVVVEFATDHKPIQSFKDLVTMGYDFRAFPDIPFFRFFIEVCNLISM
jgi:hypothetical protein